MLKSVLLPLLFVTTQISYSQDSLKKDSTINTIYKKMEELQIVKSEIIRLLREIKNDDWQAFHLIIEAPPFTNKGYNMSPAFLNMNGIMSPLWKPDQRFSEKVLGLIYRMNQGQKRNQIIFFTKREDFANASIFISYSQNIETTFESRLPKSLQGKTVPWYKKVTQ